SIGITPSHRKLPGNNASKAGTKTTSQAPPSDLAMGEPIFCERNQRAPKMAGNSGSKKAPTPKTWRTISETTAPTTPIQLRATLEPVSTDALFSEGSSGE